MQRVLLVAAMGLLAVVGTGGPQPPSSAIAAALEQTGQQGDAAPAAAPAVEPYPGWLPAGGLYGRQKWVPGSNGVDVFLPRGTEIRAPVAGVVVNPAEVMRPYPPPIPSVALRGDDGLSFYLGHVRPQVYPSTEVQAGDVIAVLDDPTLDQIGSLGPGPSGWQHVDLNVSRSMFTWYGGDIPASSWLQSTGYEGTLVDQTPGPPGEP